MCCIPAILLNWKIALMFGARHASCMVQDDFDAWCKTTLMHGIRQHSCTMHNKLCWRVQQGHLQHTNALHVSWPWFQCSRLQMPAVTPAASAHEGKMPVMALASAVLYYGKCSMPQTLRKQQAPKYSTYHGLVFSNFGSCGSILCINGLPLLELLLDCRHGCFPLQSALVLQARQAICEGGLLPFEMLLCCLQLLQLSLIGTHLERKKREVYAFQRS